MPIESPKSPLELSKSDIWEAVFERKDREFPDDKVLYVDTHTGRSYTYLHARDVALKFSKSLQTTFDWVKNDVLGLFTPNCIDTPSIIYGTHWAGGIVTPANPLYTAEELAFQLRSSNSKALVTQAQCLPVARSAAKMVGLPEASIVLIGDERHSEFRHFGDLQEASDVRQHKRPAINPLEDVAFIVYSSGTTGLPKGVLITHANIVNQLQQIAVLESPKWSWTGGPDGQGDKAVGFLPFYHIYGLTFHIYLAINRGITILVMPKFDLERFCQIVQHHRATYASVVPPVVLLLSKSPTVAKYNLSSLKMLNSAAAPLTRELVDALWTRLKLRVKQSYGLSETSPGITIQSYEEGATHIGSVGRLLPSMSAKIVDVHGTEVERGVAGEIWVTGPNVCKGYLNNPQGTKEAFSEDGYFKTGDVGYVDKDGHFYITDRVKELIKYKGSQVAPAELEGLLLSHPQIEDAAVIGVYDAEQATELPRAYVVLTHGVERGEGMAREIVEWMAERLAPTKKLRGGVRFVDAVPKSATGKILRRVLKEEAKKEMAGPKL